MQKLFLFLIYFGILALIVSFNSFIPPPIVEYRYLPRTFLHQIQDNSTIKQDIFKTMFDDNHLWLQQYADTKLQSSAPIVNR